ncbi:hypothetical protein ACLQ2S_12320 [Micromonospora sp. DT48]|uniref:hypothetical protein n=1 Tax=unclassified Micromonospora TaxID=2617518 RepID=UPI0012BCECD7|nr:hypothetical protein [Micromonospora sp. CP22]MTK02500.1 hypothetical protein [Micromonospora sp. CP22]
MSGDAVGPGGSGRFASWLGITAAVAIAAAAWVGYWWLAVPRHDLCAAVLPAPAGCRAADRVPTATTWTVVVAVIALAAAGLAVVRPRRRWWPFAVALVTLAVVALCGLWSVRYAT